MLNGVISKEVIFAVILILMIFAFVFMGCSKNKEPSTVKNKYTIDYCGQEHCYTNAKSSYKAGSKVTLYYTTIATDTNYVFYLDDEKINYEYNDKKGLVIKFTMPNHNVKLECEATNSMIEYTPYPYNTMVVDYYYSTNATVDGNGHYEIVLTTLDNSYEAQLDVYKKSEDSNETCTSYIVPYDAVYECYDVINENELDSWSKLESHTSTDGALTVCKFYKDGEHIRVSTDKMPENGEEILNMVRDTLSKYIQDDYLKSTEQ